ncbi:MAG: AmmeMemoRadiSam system protein B [Deltaproteobacteria bacterium]|nr:AmmeMemoRadiSam system protein B [Deltaproteobacteria bacterium]
MERKPAVAGQFYPADAESLRQTIKVLLPRLTAAKKGIFAAISPHAGYLYSGGVAAETLGQIDLPADIIIMGPNHHGHGTEAAVMAGGTWQMPMGPVEINQQLAMDIIDRSSIFTNDTAAHGPEHSLEVQIPFLQYLNPDIKIVPICLSFISLEKCQMAARAVAAAIKAWPRPVTIIASSDMTHYESREIAGRKDRLALSCIERLDAEALYRTVIEENITMCGFIPVTIAMLTANLLGASHAELVRYSDSGEASGDTRQVVGYAGLLIS